MSLNIVSARELSLKYPDLSQDFFQKAIDDFTGIYYLESLKMLKVERFF